MYTDGYRVTTACVKLSFVIKRSEAAEEAAIMLVLFETPAGYALFKVLKEKKLKDVKNIYEHFQTSDDASKV